MAFHLSVRHTAPLCFLLLTACSQMPQLPQQASPQTGSTISIAELLENARDSQPVEKDARSLQLIFTAGETQLSPAQRQQLETFSARFNGQHLHLSCAHATAPDIIQRASTGLSRCRQVDAQLAYRHPLSSHINPSLPLDTVRLLVGPKGDLQ